MSSRSLFWLLGGAFPVQCVYSNYRMGWKIVLVLETIFRMFANVWENKWIFAVLVAASIQIIRGRGILLQRRIENWEGGGEPCFPCRKTGPHICISPRYWFNSSELKLSTPCKIFCWDCMIFEDGFIIFLFLNSWNDATARVNFFLFFKELWNITNSNPRRILKTVRNEAHIQHWRLPFSNHVCETKD